MSRSLLKDRQAVETEAGEIRIRCKRRSQVFTTRETRYQEHHNAMWPQAEEAERALGDQATDIWETAYDLRAILLLENDHEQMRILRTFGPTPCPGGAEPELDLPFAEVLGWRVEDQGVWRGGVVDTTLFVCCCLRDCGLIRQEIRFEGEKLREFSGHISHLSMLVSCVLPPMLTEIHRRLTEDAGGVYIRSMRALRTPSLHTDAGGNTSSKSDALLKEAVLIA